MESGGDFEFSTNPQSPKKPPLDVSIRDIYTKEDDQPITMIADEDLLQGLPMVDSHAVVKDSKNAFDTADMVFDHVRRTSVVSKEKN
jgi:hypothetical protein